MKRALGILILLAAVAFSGFWLYRNVETGSFEQAEVLKAIPHDAALIIETRSAADIWRDLSQGNAIWQELQATDLYFRLNAMGQMLDSALRKQPELRSYLDNRPTVVSLHPSGARSYSFLLGIALDANGQHTDLIKHLEEILKPSETPGFRTYEGVELYSFKTPFAKSPLSLFTHDDLLVISLSQILAEESIRSLTQNAHILTIESFSQVRLTTDPFARAQIYLHADRLASIVKPYVSTEVAKSSFFTSSFGDWAALDISLHSNAIAAHGFVYASDSSSTWLPTFIGLEAPKIKVFDFMPPNTAYCTVYGFGDFEKWAARLKSFREASSAQFKVSRALESFDEACGCDAFKVASSWIGTQVASFISEPTADEYSNHQYAIFQSKDVDLTDEMLQKMAADFQGADGPTTHEFEGLPIYHLQIGKLYHAILGDVFSGLENPFAVRVGDMVLMANSLNGLRMIVQMIEAKRTLAQDEGFLEMANQIPTDAHFLTYSAIARSPYLYAGLLEGHEADNLAKRTEVVRRFQGWVYQVEHHKGNLFYNGMYLKQNPVYTQETAALWEANIGNPIKGKMHLVRNHYTNALEIVVQDVSNRLYLVSATGKVLWETVLDDPIMGDIQQVDIFKNRKLQMVFNTDSKLYVLDRNGNNVAGFPIAFATKASAGMSVVDYDGSRDYRIFVPLSSGVVQVWDGQGKTVDGWSFLDEQAPVVAPIEQIRVRRKDYILAVNAKGTIHLLDRRGNGRHTVELTLPSGYILPYVVEVPEQLISSGAIHVADSAGVLHRIGFDNRHTHFDPKFPDTRFVNPIKLTDGTTGAIIQSDESATVLNAEGDKLLQFPIDGAVGERLEVSQTAGQLAFVGIDGNGNKIYLMNERGETVEGFPVVGNISALIGNMNNDGTLQLISGISEEGLLYCYALKKLP